MKRKTGQSLRKHHDDEIESQIMTIKADREDEVLSAEAPNSVTANISSTAVSSTSEPDQTESDYTLLEAGTADMSPHLATAARPSDDWHEYEDILNPEKYFDKLDQLEGKVVLNSSLEYFQQSLYIIEKSHHRLPGLSSDKDLLAAMGALQEVIDQDDEVWRARYEIILRSLCESYSVVLQVLENLDFLRESGFCGSFFTILVATKHRREVAQVFRVERNTVDTIAESIRRSILALAALSSRLKADSQYYSQLPQGLSSMLEVPKHHCTDLLDGMGLLDQGPIDEGSSLETMPEVIIIRLATLIMNLGLVMYSGSHGSDIEKCLGTHVTPGDQSSTMEGVRTPPTVTSGESLDEVNPSRLQVLNEAATYGFQCSMKRLACLEEFIGSSVWVFERLRAEPVSAVSERRLFVSTSIEDFSDMWGPVWAVPSKERDLIRHYNVSKGLIGRVSPNYFLDLNIDACEIPCHWKSWAELSAGGKDLPFDFDNLPIKQSDKLLIGLPFQDNSICQSRLSDIDIELIKAASRLVPPGTFEEVWFTDTYQIGWSASFPGGGVSTQWTRKKRPRRTRKEAIWDNIKNSPQSFHPGIFDLWLGLEVSHCTGNAKRVKMKDVFGLDPVKNYLREVQPGLYNSDLGGQFFEALSNSDTSILRLFWERLSAQDRHDVVTMVQVVIYPLQFTGVREDKNFGVGYLSSGNGAQIILLDRHLNDWTGAVKDSETVTAYAIMSDACFEMDSGDHKTCLCKSRRCVAGYTVLKTQIIVPYGIPDHGQSCCFRLGEQGRLNIIRRTNDYILAKWEQANIREVLHNKIKKLVQPQKEIVFDRELVTDAAIGGQIFQVYIQSQELSNFGWGKFVYGY